MVSFPIILIINSAAQNVVERNIDDHMVYAKGKRIRKHSRCRLDQKSFFCLRSLIRICVFCNTFRICHISLITDNGIFTSIIDSYNKTGIQSVFLRSMIQRKLKR